MTKKFFAAVLIFLIALSVTSCSVDKEGDLSGFTSTASTQPETRIHNSFKDVLPAFGFDSTPVENYREGVSYSFSAKCSDKGFKKYIDAVKKAGFDVNAVEANGYYAAHTADRYYIEVTLVDGTITVFTKR